MGRGKAEENILEVPLSSNDLIWLHSDFVVANPRRSAEAVGFQYIRRRNVPSFAVRMDDFALSELIKWVKPWVIERSDAYKKQVLKLEAG